MLQWLSARPFLLACHYELFSSPCVWLLVIIFVPYQPNLYHVYDQFICRSFHFNLVLLWITILSIFLFADFHYLVNWNSVTSIADVCVGRHSCVHHKDSGDIGQVVVFWALLVVLHFWIYDIVWMGLCCGHVAFVNHDANLLAKGSMIWHVDFWIVLFYLTVFHLFCRCNTVGHTSLINFHEGLSNPHSLGADE